MRFVVCLLLFSSTLSTAVSAASFDCAKAEDEAERAICANAEISKLDEDLARAYTRARAARGAKRDALARDQQNWIADRDNDVREHVSDDDSKTRLNESLADLYRERIEFLGALAGDAVDASAVVRAMQQTLQKPAVSGPLHDAGFLGPLADRGARIALPKELKIGTDGYLASLPAPPTQELRDALKGAKDESSMWRWDALFLSEANLGSFYTNEGTLHCVGHTLFFVADGATRLIKTPDVLEGNCWTTGGALAVFDGTTLAMRLQPQTVHGLDVVVQTWQDGKKWSRRSRLALRYDTSLDARIGYCRSDDCRPEIAAALGYAKRFAQRPLPVSLQASLSGADAALFARMSAFAKEHPDAVAVMPREDQKLTGYGGYGGMDGFAAEARFFPARLNGELLLGRIGHPHVGWREDDDWLVAFWRLRGDQLEAVAGVPVGVVTGEILLSTPMAPPKKCGGGYGEQDCED
jgi:uncharacterized protein